VIIGSEWVVVGRESLFTNLEVIYDPVALVSKRTKAVVPQTKNSPIMTSGASASSSSVRWSASHGQQSAVVHLEEVGFLEQVLSWV
jgi:hypothetical protein